MNLDAESAQKEFNEDLGFGAWVGVRALGVQGLRV